MSRREQSSAAAREVAEVIFEGLPMGHFGAIVADPPWRFAAYDGPSNKIERHYDTMSLGAICSLPVAELAARDCALFLWVTDPLLEAGLEVMRAWGFRYKTVAFTWAKTLRSGKPGWHTGMGYWTRSNPEMALFGTRGRPKRLAADVRQLVVSPRREHSRKPDEIFPAVERLLAGPHLELFSRTSRPGWHAWGGEAGKFAPEPQGIACRSPGTHTVGEITGRPNPGSDSMKNFDEWFRELVNMGEALGVPVNRQASESYGEAFEDGMTPRETLEEEAANA